MSNTPCNSLGTHSQEKICQSQPFCPNTKATVTYADVFRSTNVTDSGMRLRSASAPELPAPIIPTSSDSISLHSSERVGHHDPPLVAHPYQEPFSWGSLSGLEHDEAHCFSPSPPPLISVNNYSPSISAELPPPLITANIPPIYTPTPDPSNTPLPTADLPSHSVPAPQRPSPHKKKRKYSSRILTRGSWDSIGKSLSTKCCPAKCSADYTSRQIMKARRVFLNMTHQLASQWLLTIMIACYSPEDLTWGKFQVLGATVCLNAFLLFHGISKSQWYSVRTSFLAGRRNFTHASTGTTSPSPKSHLITSWMNSLILSVGDTLTNSEIHLPMGMRKVDLHARMIRELRISHPHLQEADLPSCLLFRKIWKHHVKTPKKTRLGKCDICSKLNKQRDIETDPLKLRRISNLLFRHVGDISSCCPLCIPVL